VRRPRILFGVVTFGLAVVACGGIRSGSDDAGATGGDGSADQPACAPEQGRATAKTCALSAAPPSHGDAGAPPGCATDADCATPGSAYPYCRAALCSFDACLTDADCATGGVCVCSTDYYGGNVGYPPNVCVPATCHVDADCGASGICGETTGGCAPPSSYHCGKTTDRTCPETTCSYGDEVGKFVCVAPAICTG
jgi:hypothetical protein